MKDVNKPDDKLNDNDSLKVDNNDSTETAPDIDVAEIGENLIADMPEVSESAIQAMNVPEEKEENKEKIKAAEATSGNDEIFDPERHIPGPDGKGIKTNSGKFRKKPGRKKGYKVQNSTLNSPESDMTNGNAPDTTAAPAYVSGIAAANLLMTIGVSIGGDEWQPKIDPGIGLDEKSMLEGAFAEYFTAKGITDIPPGFGLIFAIGAYSLPRFTMPKTKTRLQRVGLFVKSKWLAFRAKRTGGVKETPKTEGNNNAA